MKSMVETTLSDDITTLKGIVQVQDTMIKKCKEKMVNLMMLSMANNIVITDRPGDSEGHMDYKAKVVDFMKDKM